MPYGHWWNDTKISNGNTYSKLDGVIELKSKKKLKSFLVIGLASYWLEFSWMAESDRPESFKNGVCKIHQLKKCKYTSYVKHFLTAVLNRTAFQDIVANISYWLTKLI